MDPPPAPAGAAGALFPKGSARRANGLIMGILYTSAVFLQQARAPAREIFGKRGPPGAAGPSCGGKSRGGAMGGDGAQAARIARRAEPCFLEIPLTLRAQRGALRELIAPDTRSGRCLSWPDMRPARLCASAPPAELGKLMFPAPLARESAMAALPLAGGTTPITGC